MTRTSEPLVSIVTPVYNGAEYLEECIQSVLRQTYGNWEYTLLDNCSTDATSEIAHRYAASEPRIRVHRNDQVLPVIANHNAALRLISPRSTYCKVVFADDWIFPECLERMVSLAESNPTVGLVSAYALMGSEVICAGLPYDRKVVPGREIGRRHFLEKLHLFGSANCVLYRADLVRGRGAFYNEANIHADTEACFDVLRDCDFGFVHQVLTFTRVRPGSLTSESERLTTHFAGTLRVLLNHGRHYFTAEELEQLMASQVANYYDFLGRRVILWHGRDHLSYHQRQLRELGFGFNWGRLVWAVVRNLTVGGLSPAASLARARKRFASGLSWRRASGAVERPRRSVKPGCAVSQRRDPA